MRTLLFSAEGRLPRSQYWKGVLLMIAAAVLMGLVCVALAQVIPSDPTTDGSYSVHGTRALPYLILVFGYIGLAVWAGICLGIKRFHDRGKPGLWILIQFVPFIGSVWYVIETGFLKGTSGPNAYGPDALQDANATPPLGVSAA